MATTKKTTTTKSKTIEVAPAVQEGTLENSEDVIAKLMAEIEALKKQVATPAPVAELKSVGDKMITFVSLSQGSVMLRGSAARPYEIDGQYKSRTFTETEARIIVNQMGGYMREGFVYIDDAEFVREAGLTDAYNNILTPKKLKTLLDNKPELVVSAYENTTDGQKDIIIRMVREKLAAGQYVDGNIVMRLSKLSGKDLTSIIAEDNED